MINIRNRNNLYEYRFEAGKVNGKRKQISKFGFKTKKEAYLAGQRSYENFMISNGIYRHDFNQMFNLKYIREYLEKNSTTK